ncbi:MAG: L-aspartate oxidase, partial [Candidatus Gottesmanbacteria bacterium GW2011_GWC2_39_8]
MDFDFIIIGSGLSGLITSLILEKYGNVLIVTKRKPEDGSTSLAQGGIAAVVSEKDSFISHAKDTMNAGCHLNNLKAVKFLVKDAPKAVDFLNHLGVPFDRKGSEYILGKEGAHSFPRIVHASDFTGQNIEQTLLNRVINSKRIAIWENTFTVKLLMENDVCLGVQIIKDDNVINCLTGTVVLATGGLGQVYLWTTNPEVSTGDGIAMANQAGAEIQDLEFIQFHPTALESDSRPLFLLSEAIRGEGAKLVNTQGKRFMEIVDPRMELAPRDIVAREVFRQKKKGRVYLDIRHKGKQFLEKRFPNIFSELKKRGINMSLDLIPITPAAHYSSGGIKVDLYGRTNIPNLFAFGEVSCTGIHGANRLASNSLPEAVVFPMHFESIVDKLPKEIPHKTFPLPRITG